MLTGRSPPSSLLSPIQVIRLRSFLKDYQMWPSDLRCSHASSYYPNDTYFLSIHIMLVATITDHPNSYMGCPRPQSHIAWSKWMGQINLCLKSGERAKVCSISRASLVDLVESRRKRGSRLKRPRRETWSCCSSYAPLFGVRTYTPSSILQANTHGKFLRTLCMVPLLAMAKDTTQQRWALFAWRVQYLWLLECRYFWDGTESCSTTFNSVARNIDQLWII